MASKATCAPAWASPTARNRNGCLSPLSAGGSQLGRLCGRHEFASLNKSKAPDRSGASCAREVYPPREGKSLPAAAFRSSHVIAAGTSIVLTRRTHRAGTTPRARPCRPFFMLRFLAGSSAGTDGSRTRCAGRGLGLSRRHERRAEQRRNDEGRDCKFGSHREYLHWLHDHSKSLGCDSVPALGQHCANFMFQKLVRDCCVSVHYFSKHPSPSEHRIYAKRVQW
jgi:hypothetical protein